MMKEKEITDTVRKLNEKMLCLANKGEKLAKDDSCLVLYSIIRDNAYRIQKQILDDK